MSKNIYVGNLAFTATGEDLREWFSAYGEVTRAQVTMDRETGRSRGFGFVEMASGGDEAIAAMNGKEVGGFLMVPREVPPEERDMLYQFYGSVDTNEELVSKYRDLMEGISSLPFLAGFCYTQLTDIEQESNGLLTYDRRAKVAPERVAEIHRELFRK